MLFTVAFMAIVVAVAFAFARILCWAIATPIAIVIAIDMATLRLLLTRWLLIRLSMDNTIARSGYVYAVANYGYCYGFVSGYGSRYASLSHGYGCI